MKVLYISESIGENSFGVAKVVFQLFIKCQTMKVHCKAMDCDLGVCDINKTRIPLYKFSHCNNTVGRMFRWHHNMMQTFNLEIDKFKPDVVHVHGVQTLIQALAVTAASKRGVAVLLSPHGMLEPWMWKQKGWVYYWLKQVYWKLLLKPAMKQVDYVHAITCQESETIKHEFPRVSQIKIPNAIDLNEYQVEQVEPDKHRYLLFLGRLHPVKGVDILLQAFAKAMLANMRLVIAGPDFDLEYTVKLKALVESLACSETVSFIGSVGGREKAKLLKEAWCVVVPSYSEVIAMVNLESAASYTPTITTKVTGLSDWEEGGGLLIDSVLDELAYALEKVATWSEKERMKRGKKSRELVEQRYSWDVIGEQWVEAYKMIAESGKKKHEL